MVYNVRGTNNKGGKYMGVRGANIYMMVLCACKGIHGVIYIFMTWIQYVRIQINKKKRKKLIVSQFIVEGCRQLEVTGDLSEFKKGHNRRWTI